VAVEAAAVEEGLVEGEAAAGAGPTGEADDAPGCEAVTSLCDVDPVDALNTCDGAHRPWCTWTLRLTAAITTMVGDNLQTLVRLARDRGKVFQTIVTSPPYFALRDYNIRPSAWPEITFSPMAGYPAVTVPAMVCPLGLEPDLVSFTAHIVHVFRLLREVLRDDGTAWVNMGDSYAVGTSAARPASKVPSDPGGMSPSGWTNRSQSVRRTIPELASKQLTGQAWRVAFALQADGWWLREDIVEHRKNPLPESVTDRPVRAHSFVFLLAKSPRYFYDGFEIREPCEAPQSGTSTADRDAERAFSRRRETAPTPTQGAYRSRNVERRTDRERGRDDHRGTAVPWEDAGIGRAARDVWSLASEPFPGAHFACVDADTECLTTDGWKRHDQLLPGMIAAQYDVAAQRLSWAPVEEVYQYPAEGLPMVVAKCRDVEMVLTPNHRTIVRRRHNVSRQYQAPTIIRADELRPSHAIPVAAPWDEAGDEPVSADWAELIGWYIAEGCATQNGWSVEIYQSHTANPEKVVRIRQLLNVVGAEYTEATATREWAGEARVLGCFQVRGFAAAMLRQWAPDKSFHPSVLRWSAPLLRRLLDGLVDGDGHRRSDGRFVFIQRSKPTADIVQAIGARLGYATMLSARSGSAFAGGAAAGYRNRGSWVVYFTQRQTLSFRGTAGRGAEIGTRPYTGVVWCPKLPLGTWVARRNGRAFITGNTMPSELAEKCVLAGTSTKGCCPTCRAPWLRLLETEYVAPEGPDGEAPTDDAKRSVKRVATKGWESTCRCPAHEPVPCLVLDPYGGSATTGEVSEGAGREAVLCELNREYVGLQVVRVGRAKQRRDARDRKKRRKKGGARLPNDAPHGTPALQAEAHQLDLFGAAAPGSAMETVDA